MANSIKHIILDYLRDVQLSEDDRKVFEAWLAAAEQNRMLLEEMNDPARVAASLAKINSLREAEIWERVNAHSAAGKEGEGRFVEQPMHRVHFLKRAAIWWAAAAVLLLFAVSTYFLVRRPAAVPPVIVDNPVQKDILPGSNKAVLTLAGGQTIVLDSAAKGTLAQQGAARIVKLADGQLSYTSDNVQKQAEVLYNTLTTPRGGQYRLSLPDGTEVWLNAASSITYPTVFAAAERNVSITGEAYFEVAKDKTRPFRVTANAMTVEVLGTHFNVNAYLNEADTKTTLLEGSVLVNKGGATQRLRPGQQAQVSHDQPQIKLADDVNTNQVVAWKNGLFDFKDADLATVLRQVERWYDIQVQYKTSLPGFAFQGKLQRNLNLSQILKVLTENEINYTMEGHTLVIKP
jgi:transmembrane sensor